MGLGYDVEWLRGTSRQWKSVPETKRSIAHAVLYWQELIPFYQRLFRIIFKICFSRSCLPVGWPNRHILEILLPCKHTLVALNFGRVLGYTTALDDVLEQQMILKNDIHIFKESAKPKEAVKKEWKH